MFIVLVSCGYRAPTGHPEYFEQVVELSVDVPHNRYWRLQIQQFGVLLQCLPRLLSPNVLSRR
jgi:hypothetical protein